MSTIRTGVHSADGIVGKAPGEVPPGADDGLMRVILSNLFARSFSPTHVSQQCLATRTENWKGRPVSILNAPGTEAPEEVAGQIIADLRNQGVWRGEVENVRKDGSRFRCAANVTAFEHGNWGTVWVTIQLDISARKRAEAELRQSEQQLNLVLEPTGSGAWDWNIQTGDVYFSRFWISSLGYASQEVAPRVTSWESMVHRAFRWSHGYIRMCAAPAEEGSELAVESGPGSGGGKVAHRRTPSNGRSSAA